VQDGKLAHAIFPPRWDDVIHDELVLDQDRNIARASFAPRWDDFV
jgi:hypothetical protein